MKDVEELHHSVGVKVVQKPDSKKYGSPKKRTQSVLQRFDMDDWKPVSIAFDLGTTVVKPTEDSKGINQIHHQSAVVHLVYLSTKTRPDVAYAVSNVARFNAEPTKQH